MKILVLGVLVLIQFGLWNFGEIQKNDDNFLSPVAAQCSNTGSEIKGNIRICYYNCGGVLMYTTIDIFSSCPFIINM